MSDFNTISGEIIVGDDQENFLTGLELDDSISGEGGDDRLSGYDGNDTINGGEGRDTIYGEAGNDVIDSGLGSDLVFAGAGDDYVSLGENVPDSGFYEMAYGGDGNDTIIGSGLSSYHYGEAGNDVIDGRDGDDRIDGGSGADTLTGGAGVDKFFFDKVHFQSDITQAPVVTDFTLGEDQLGLLNTGMDLLAAYDGEGEHQGQTVVIERHTGDFVAVFENMNAAEFSVATNIPLLSEEVDIAVIHGTSDQDTLAAADHDVIDTLLVGYEGDDTIWGRAGNDTIEGGAGRDRIESGNGDDVIFGQAGVDWVFSSDGNDFISLGSDTDVGDYEYAIGGRGNDTIIGSGMGGTHLGGDDNDLINGRGGNDYIDGGRGVDTLTGGAGQDEFVLSKPRFNADITQADVITDFTSGEDGLKIHFTGTNLLAAYDGEGDYAGHTIVIERETGDFAAVFENISAQVFSDFTHIPLLSEATSITHIDGHSGADTLSAVEYDVVDTTIYGYDGKDRIDGADGNDTIYGGNGNDFILAGSGNDVIYAEAGGDDVLAGDGDDFISLGDNTDTGYHEIARGGTGNDTIIGSGIASYHYGEDGNDVIDGQNGDDTIDGGAGSDTLTGGAGADEFNFDTKYAVENVADADYVTDFVTGTDVIYLNGLNGDNRVHLIEGTDGENVYTVLALKATGGIVAVFDDVRADELASEFDDPIVVPLPEEPVVEEPVVEEPVVEEPVVEDPVVEEPVAEEPVVEEPVVEEPVVEDPVVEEPVVEEPVVEEPVVEEPVVEEPVAEEPVVEEPVAEEPVAEEPVVEEPVAEEPVVEEPVAGDKDKGHGNDADGYDEDNPGKSKGLPEQALGKGKRSEQEETPAEEPVVETKPAGKKSDEEDASGADKSQQVIKVKGKKGLEAKRRDNEDDQVDADLDYLELMGPGSVTGIQSYDFENASGFNDALTIENDLGFELMGFDLI